MTHRVACCACSLVLLSALSACHPLEPAGSEFANGVPRQETVAMAVPGSEAKAITVESDRRALEGQTAEWYTVTRTVSHTVNGGAIAVGALVRLVTDYPATSVTADSATWGPWQGPLDPVEWKVTVTRLALHQYSYTFEGRDKHAPAAPFVTVLAGAHTPGLDANDMELEGFGAGSFTLDWNARATLPGHDGTVGTAHYVYDHMGPARVVSISAQLRKVKDEKDPAKLLDVDYVFVQNPGATGSMDFLYNVPASPTAAGGVGKVRSRWLWSGAGRSDVVLIPSDSPLTYTLSECWDINYLSVYKSVPLSSSPTDNYGSEAACAFPTAETSSL